MGGVEICGLHVGLHQGRAMWWAWNPTEDLRQVLVIIRECVSWVCEDALWGHERVTEPNVGRRLDGTKKIRHWMIGHQSVSSLSDVGRHNKSWTLPLSGRARSEARYSGSLQKMGTESENIIERMEKSKRYSRTPTQWKPAEQRKFQNEDVEVRKAPKLQYASGRFQGPCGH